MKRKQWAIYVLALIVLLTLMTGCGAKSETENGQVTEPQAQEEQKDQELGKLLSKQFVDLMSGDKYLMKYRTSMNMEGRPVELEATVAVSGENSAITSTANGMVSTMITKDGKSYIIDHESKTILVLPETPDAEDPSIDGSAGIVDVDSDIKYVDTGKEGNLVYEEYSTTDGTIRYYFDGDKLVKMVVNSDGQSMTMEILEISDKVSDDIFDIPADYQMMNM